MNVRLAEEKDLLDILKIYENARQFMKVNGNPDQWKDNYPPKNLIENDIKEHKYLRVVEDEKGRLIGVFFFKIGKDKTYKTIKGKRIDESKYGVIPRIATHAL